MVYASYPEVFESDPDPASGIELTIPLAYLRLVVCCLTASDVIWMDSEYGVTSLTDQERDLLDTAIATITEAINDA